MDEGSGTLPMGRLYDPPLYDMLDIKLNTLNDRKQQDRLVPCDNGEAKAWFQGGTNKIVPNLRDRLESRHQEGGHLGCRWVSFLCTSTVGQDSHHCVVVHVLEKSPVGFTVIID